MFRLPNQGRYAFRLAKPFLVLSLLVFFSLTYTQGYAQSYPNRTVKMVVPLTTGSGADIAGRVVAKSLTETWKQSVIIENRPGAGEIGRAHV